MSLSVFDEILGFWLRNRLNKTLVDGKNEVITSFIDLSKDKIYH